MNRKSTLLRVITALATLIVTSTAIFSARSAQAATAHTDNKVVKTTVSLRTATQIGNTTLTPGTETGAKSAENPQPLVPESCY